MRCGEYTTTSSSMLPLPSAVWPKGGGMSNSGLQGAIANSPVLKDTPHILYGPRTCKGTCHSVQAGADTGYDTGAVESEEDNRFDIAPWYGPRIPQLGVSVKEEELIQPTDTGQPVFLPFRMSCFVISNLVVTAGMLTPNLGVTLPLSTTT
jgi:Sideroflexins